MASSLLMDGAPFVPSSSHATPLSASRIGLVPPTLQNSGAAPPPPPKAVLQALPPHRRAQIILQDMAGLTLRLLELAGSRWQGGYLKSIIPPFLTGVPVPAEGLAATSTREVLALLESQQQLLSEAVLEISELQALEQEKQKIAEAIAAKDGSMRDFAKRVRDAEQVLEFTLEEYDEYRNAKKDTGAGEGDDMSVGLGTIDVEQLISYAHRISYTTFAPPDFTLGQPGALAPAPQEPQMRASQLYQYSDMELGPPEEATPLKVEVPMPQVPAAAAAAAAFPAGVPAPPPMPAGWKPGDKIMMGDKITVPFVNIDLNPELEDDYGSEDYSDEDEQSSGESE